MKSWDRGGGSTIFGVNMLYGRTDYCYSLVLRHANTVKTTQKEGKKGENKKNLSNQKKREKNWMRLERGKQLTESGGKKCPISRGEKEEGGGGGWFQKKRSASLRGFSWRT